MQQYAVLGRAVYSKVKFGLLKLCAFVHILDCQLYECCYDGVWCCGVLSNAACVWPVHQVSGQHLLTGPCDIPAPRHAYEMLCNIQLTCVYSSPFQLAST